MHFLTVACLVVCVSLAAPAPQVYQASGVLQPDTADLGPYDKVVAATIDLLPEITQVFERVGRVRSDDPEQVSRVIQEFMPVSRKAWKAAAEVDGTSIKEEDLYRFNAAEAVLPSVITFMNQLRDMQFLGGDSQAVQAANI
ncbi:uncharacterized protein [Procambarus clarkii]|uniref:uncharacterized protein isoform X2 n=1 Tax=Procambarus clarkii TaxID=6728 RepID=UPI001E676B5D|nr:uncharacterized protein LOC123767114 isoform X2 [Procambarus clarkii]